MSRIVSFSTDNEFAENLDGLIEKSGYQNRSRFLRDAALFYAEMQQRGDLENMEDDVIIQGHILIYYQHGIENKLLDIRHSTDIDVSSYNHSCLKKSHSCVDVVEAIGTAKSYRNVIKTLKNTPSVDKVSFISAPMRDDGCC